MKEEWLLLKVVRDRSFVTALSHPFYSFPWFFPPTHFIFLSQNKRSNKEKDMFFTYRLTQLSYVLIYLKTLQPKTNGFTSPWSQTSKKPAKKSSPSSNMPTPPFPPIHPDRSDSWSAARMPNAICVNLYDPGPVRTRSDCAGITMPIFIERASYCLTLRGSCWTDPNPPERKNKDGRKKKGGGGGSLGDLGSLDWSFQ